MAKKKKGKKVKKGEKRSGLSRAHYISEIVKSEDAIERSALINGLADLMERGRERLIISAQERGEILVLTGKKSGTQRRAVLEDFCAKYGYE